MDIHKEKEELNDIIREQMKECGTSEKDNG